MRGTVTLTPMYWYYCPDARAYYPQVPEPVIQGGACADHASAPMQPASAGSTSRSVTQCVVSPRRRTDRQLRLLD